MSAPVVMMAVLAAFTTAAFAQDYPKLKAGKWELTTDSGKGGAPTKSTMCTDEALQK